MHRQRRDRRTQGGRVDPWIMILAMQLAGRIARMERKPPVTLMIMAACVFLHMRPAVAAGLGGGYGAPMMCPSELVQGQRPWSHLLLSAFVHADDGGHHLYFNMAVWRPSQ